MSQEKRLNPQSTYPTLFALTAILEPVLTLGIAQIDNIWNTARGLIVLLDLSASLRRGRYRRLF